MDFETAEVSLIGDRAENQDRVEILIRDEGAFAIVADGMGGHNDGALAAETAVASLGKAFRAARGTLAEPEEFLTETLLAAHAEVLALGEGMPLEVKPGSVVVCALILGNTMWWAHVGDGRAYYLRGGRLLARTRDHTEIEMLLEAGKISPEEAERHPARHTVEYCLGVAPEAPPTGGSEPMTLADKDVILLCSDGLWSQIEESALLAELSGDRDLQGVLETLAGTAARDANPHSDNVTALALRMHAEEGT